MRALIARLRAGARALARRVSMADSGPMRSPTDDAWADRPHPSLDTDLTLWNECLEAHAFLRDLDTEARTRLVALARQFLRDKAVSSAHDLVLEPRMLASIALQACLPILELGLDRYQDWRGVVIYPGPFKVVREDIDEFGVTHVWEEELAGEAWPGGPVILSWQDAENAEAGYNVVIHEFAHKLAMHDGSDSGIPAAPPGMSGQAWQIAIERSFVRVESAVRCARPLPIDDYAASNPGEFFAVMSEQFFTGPAVLSRHLPELYSALVHFYRQDPLERVLRARQRNAGLT